MQAWVCPPPELGSPSHQPSELRPHAPPAPWDQVTAAGCSHVVEARPPVGAMAAADSNVVRRVEELGDLAQAHIQQLSEAAGEDGEAAERREAGGRTVVQSWRFTAVRAGGCGLWFVCIPRRSY